MANYYWISGGTNNWTSTNTANWSTDPNSSRAYPGNAGVPGSLDNAYFDQYSGSAAVRASSGMLCYNLSTVGFAGDFSGSGQVQNIRIYGESINLGCTLNNVGLNIVSNIGSPVTYNQLSSTTRPARIYAATATTNGVVCTSDVYIPSYLYHNNGTFSAGSNNITIGAYNYSTSGTTPFPVLNMGSKTWTTTSQSGTAYSWVPNTNLTINKETADIVWYISVGVDSYFSAAGYSFNKLTIADAGGVGWSYFIMGGGSFSEVVYLKTSPNFLRFDHTATTTVSKFSASGNYVWEGQWIGSLSGNIDENTTTISVSSWYDYTWVSGIPQVGSIKIGDEVITYTAFDGVGTFSGCTRGANGTNKSAHNDADGLYVPRYLYVHSDLTGTQATINTVTDNGVFYSGMNSLNGVSNSGGNNNGITFNNRGNCPCDYNIFRDINMVTTAQPKNQFFNLFNNV